MKPQNHGIDINLRDFQHHVSVDVYGAKPQASLKLHDLSPHLPHGAEDQSRGLFSEGTEKPHMVTVTAGLPPDLGWKQVLTNSWVKQPTARRSKTTQS